MIELLQKYPKAAKLVKEYYIEQLMKGLKEDLPEDFKEHVREMGVDDEKIAKLMEVSPYGLFSFFDNNNILISIHAFEVDGKNKTFGYTIDSINKSNALPDRLTAETGAIINALEILEKEL